MRDPVAANTTSDQILGEPGPAAPARSVGHELDHTELAQNVAKVEPTASRKIGDPRDRDQETVAPLAQSLKPEGSRLIVHQKHGAALPK
jgi:hypothetical protein